MNTNNASTPAPKTSVDSVILHQILDNLGDVVDERDALKTENEEMRATIDALKSYLLSSKFAVDTTVQVADVLTRIGAR